MLKKAKPNLIKKTQRRHDLETSILIYLTEPKSFLLSIIPAAHFKSEAGRDVYSESTQFKFWPESVHSKKLWSEAALGFLGKQSCGAAGHLQCGWERGFWGLQRFPKKNCTNSPELEHFPLIQSISGKSTPCEVVEGRGRPSLSFGRSVKASSRLEYLSDTYVPRKRNSLKSLIEDWTRTVSFEVCL